MKHRRFVRVSHRQLLWAALLAAPSLLAAKGCGDEDDDEPSVAVAAATGVGVQCDDGSECAAGTFCSFELDAACGAGDRTGTCQPITAACTQDFTPVCGCDGNTYANTCVANAAGVSVASAGECGDEADACGGDSGDSTCGVGRFCSYSLPARCGLDDDPGTCQPTPDACTQQLAPVCGCDEVTYDNECVANAAGVSVWTPGACPELGDPCLVLGPSCGLGRFCNFPISAGCGNEAGVCEVIPEACTRELVPVCGCDRNSYDNECLARAAGVSVAGPGACP